MNIFKEEDCLFQGDYMVNRNENENYNEKIRSQK